MSASPPRRRRVPGLLALCAAGALTLAPSAFAAFPGQNGRIVAAIAQETIAPDGSVASTAYDLVTVNPDGTGLRSVPGMPGGAYGAPQWSADGTRIVFEQASGDPDANIWVVSPDGTGLTAAGTGTEPQWSPDGTRIVARRRGTGLVVRQLAGGTESVLVPEAPYFAGISTLVPGVRDGSGRVWRLQGLGGWSPDGARIAIVGRDGSEWAILLVDAATGQVGTLPLPAGVTTGNTLEWSPDGLTLVTACFDGVAGGFCTFLTDGTPQAVVPMEGPGTPDLSPQGDRILGAVADVPNYPAFDLVTDAVAGGDRRTVIDMPQYGTVLGADWQPVPGAPLPDADGDGVADAIQTAPGVFSDGASSGSIIDTAGLPVLVTDAAAPDGVSISVGGTGPAKAVFSVCGFTVRLAAGSEATLTCGSVSLRMAAGTGEIVLGGGLGVVSVPAGGSARVADAAGGTYTVQNQGATPVTLTVDGVTSTLPAGATGPVAPWNFVGFESPVRTAPGLNTVRADRTVRLGYRVLDAAGAPVTGLARPQVRIHQIDCATREKTGGETALQGVEYRRLGGGRYALLWDTPERLAGSCRSVSVLIGDGVRHTALFRFTR